MYWQISLVSLVSFKVNHWLAPVFLYWLFTIRYFFFARMRGTREKEEERQKREEGGSIGLVNILSLGYLV